MLTMGKGAGGKEQAQKEDICCKVNCRIRGAAGLAGLPHLSERCLLDTEATHPPRTGKTDVAHDSLQDRSFEKYVYKKQICMAKYYKVHFLAMIFKVFLKYVLYYNTLYSVYIATTTIHYVISEFF